MALDTGLIVGDAVASSNRNLKVVVCVVCALAAGVMLGAVVGGLNSSNQEASRMASDVSDLLAMPANFAGLTNAKGVGFSGGPASPLVGYQSQFRGKASRVQAVQDNLKMFGITSSPLQKLALTAIDTNNRGNRYQGYRAPDVAMKAQANNNELVSGWSEVDPETRRKLSKVIDQVEAKESLLAGISAPMGFFDPIGFSTTVTGGKLLFYREVELKHGRVAMLAALGILVGENFHPLFGGNIDVPAYVAFQQTPLQAFWPAVVAAIAIPEIFSVFTFQDPTNGEQWAMKLDHVPGDLGFDPLGLKPTDPKEFKEMQTKELNNGRLAMIAAAGMIGQELATGQKLFE